LEKVKIIGDKRQGPKYAFVTFKHTVSVPYALQLMNGIRLYDQPLRLKERTGSGSGNTGYTVESLPPQPAMGPPQLMPPSLHGAPLSLMAVHPGNHNIYGAHARLLRSSSEPEGLGSGWHESRRTGNMAQVHERAAGPYSRPHVQHSHSQGIRAQNIASQLYARSSHSNFHRQQNHYNQFNAHSGFRHR